MEMKIKCSCCGWEIFPEEIYYALCVHIEVQDPKIQDVRILDMQPLEFRCRLCAETAISVCQ